jgi:hypothetical protein
MSISDDPAVKAKLFTRLTRDHWQVYLWEPTAVLFNGWIPLEDEQGHSICFDRAEAVANLALARRSYGPDADLRLLRWTLQEEP